MALYYDSHPDACPQQLTDEINLAIGIPVAENVRIDDITDLTISFAAPLSPAQETTLANVVAAHICAPITTDTGGNELDQGTGLVIENDGVLLAGDVSSINFQGSVAVTSSSSGTISTATVHVGHTEVRNDTGISIPAMSPVYVVGYDNSTNQTLVSPCDASVSSKMPAFGILEESLAIGQSGLVVVSGETHNSVTSGWTIGDELYVAVGGGLTTTRPLSSTNFIQKVAHVLSVDATAGKLHVFGAGRANDLPNISTGTVWMGDANDVPQPTNVYTQAQTDAAISSASSGVSTVLAYGDIPGMYGTTKIPYDNTTPKINEGTEIFSVNVAPSTSSRKIKIHITFTGAAKSKKMITAVFRDSVCIGTTMMEDEGDDDPYTVSLLLIDAPTTTSPVTYSMRVGTEKSSGKWYVNRIKYSKLNGTMIKNSYMIEEFE